MFTTLRNAWKIPELRKKILFTLIVMLIYRLGNCVPVPYVNVIALNNYFTTQLANTVLGLYNAMSGSAFSQATVFALGIQPYINASIIIELLTIAIPALERLAKEDGEEGRKKIQNITRYTTIGLGLLMGFAYYVMLKNYSLLSQTGFVYGLVIVLTFTAGASFLMWMGEQINEFGIGNGISMILFAGIVSRIPQLVSNMVTSLSNGTLKWYTAILLVVGILAIMVFIVFITNSERRIPVQYAKRVVGRKMYGGQSTHIPIKVNSAGVIPVIFAMSLMFFPGTIASFFPDNAVASWISQNFSFDNVAYNLIYAVLIIFFTYFYSSITFNPIDVADNIRKNGGFIPGIRPGRPTSEYIMKVMSRITFFGGLFLACIAVLPAVLMGVANMDLYFGGTSLLIVVGVAIDTMKQIESNMMMRNYEGFMK